MVNQFDQFVTYVLFTADILIHSIHFWYIEKYMLFLTTFVLAFICLSEPVVS